MSKKRLLQQYLEQQEENDDEYDQYNPPIYNPPKSDFVHRHDFELGLKKSENIQIIIPPIDPNYRDEYFQGIWNTNINPENNPCKIKVSPKNGNQLVLKFQFNSHPKEYVETYDLPKELLNLETNKNYYNQSKNKFGSFVFCFQIMSKNRGYTLKINKKYYPPKPKKPKKKRPKIKLSDEEIAKNLQGAGQRTSRKRDFLSCANFDTPDSSPHHGKYQNNTKNGALLMLNNP
jgi:hypothetical protein